MADDYPPRRQEGPDPQARAQAWRLALPPAVFLLHFGAVYGWAGVGCAFGWGDTRLGPLDGVGLGVLALTLLALGLLGWGWPRRVPHAPEEAARPYDPRERAHFMATVTRMTAVLAGVGVLAVAAMAVVAGTCTGAP